MNNFTELMIIYTNEFLSAFSLQRQSAGAFGNIYLLIDFLIFTPTTTAKQSFNAQSCFRGAMLSFVLANMNACLRTLL